jgi:8-oxo-dGTP diphosphatase
MVKHFTATVVLVTRGTPKRVLLGLHRKLGVWLPPGGHIEEGEHPIDAAIREVREESGIDISGKFRVDAVDSRVLSLPLPQYLFEETIPEWGEKPEHKHIDLVYVVEVDAPPEAAFPDQELSGMRWFARDELAGLPMYPNLEHRILADVLG